MKKYVLALLMLSSTAFSHNQHVHQYLGVQGYNLLKTQLGLDIPILKDRIGGADVSYIGPGPWQIGCVTTGEWREDMEDVVYGYCNSHPPEGCSSEFITSLLKAMNGNSEFYSSVTHFWYADDGDNVRTTMTAAAHLIPPRIGPILTSTMVVENAYQKMMAFVNGGFDLNVQLEVRGFPINSDGTGYCARNAVIMTFTYNSLFDLFRNKNLYVKKVTWIGTGQTTYYNPPIHFTSGTWYPSNNTVYGSFNQFFDVLTFEILGRMCHLLQDMSVPAHANLDPHGDDDALIVDYYESYFGYTYYWNYQNTLAQIGGYINPYQSANPLHFLMYTTSQMANHFATQGPHYRNNNDNFGGDHSQQELTYLASVNVPGLGNPISHNGPFDDASIINVRDKLLPQAIRATAGLLYWFSVEAGLWPPQSYSIALGTGRLAEGGNGGYYATYSTTLGPTYSGSLYHGEDITAVAPSGYQFSGWSDGCLDNPRRVNGAIDSYAYYKTPLSSTNAYVTSSSGQRRVATTVNGRFKQAIYESAGEIWHMIAYDSEPYQPERRVSPGTGGHRDPSIACDGSKTYAVWERVLGTTHTIYFAKAELGIWSAPLAVASFSQLFDGYHANPLVSIHRGGESPKPLFIDYQTLGWNYELVSRDGGTSWSSLLSFGASEKCLHDMTAPMYGAFLVGSLVYQTRRINSLGWESYELVPGSNWVNFSGESDFTESWCWGPQVGAPNWGYSRIYTAWAELQTCEYTHRYIVQQNRNFGWEAVTAYEVNPDANEVGNPSLGLDPNFGTILWSEDNSLKKVSVTHSTGTWGTPTTLGSGRYPAVSNADGMAYLSYVYTQSGSPLSALVSGPLNLPKPDLIPNTERNYSRVVFGVDTVKHRSISIHMTQPILGTTRIAFSPVNDTALGLDVDNVMAFLGSSDIRPLTSSDTLEFALSYSSHGLEDSELPLSIAVDGTSQSRSLGSIALMDCKMKDKFQSVRVKSPVKNMKGLPFAIRPRALSVRSLGPNWVFGLAHVFSIRPGGSKYAKLQQIGESGIGIPADVGLKNYPNPFNPSTIIRFELPRSSQVKLSVFDMLGREVSMLVNDKREAGIHEVQFDGSQLASGVYLYRLQADEVVQTRKLILLK